MMNIVVFNPGTHPAPKWIASELAARGRLTSYVTGLAFSADEAEKLGRRLGRVLSAEVRRRTLPYELSRSELCRGALATDVLATFALRQGRPRLTRQLLDRRNRVLARKAARMSSVGSVVLLPTGTRSNILGRLRGRRIALYTPLPAGPSVANILRDEAQRNPRWAEFLGVSCPDDTDVNEANASSLVLANSTVSAHSFIAHGVDRNIVKVVPLSVDREAVRVAANVTTREPTGRRGPLDLVFVGQLNQRKGLSYLFEALSRIPSDDYTLTLVGPDTMGMANALTYRFPRVRATFTGPVAKEKVWDTISKSHVLVFPSLIEGFGNVILEALALGVPVLTTSSTGALDIPGFSAAGAIVEPGCADILESEIRALIEDDEHRVEMAHATRDVGCFGGWQDYATRAVARLTDISDG